jgi:Major capsid protein Gp23
MKVSSWQRILQAIQQSVDTKTKRHILSWKLWFAWYPVKQLNGNYVWLKKTFRRGSPIYKKGILKFKYIYGNEFDVLKNPTPEVGPQIGGLIIPLIRKVMPGIIASQIVGVQPMQGSVGQIHTMKIKPNQNNAQNNNNQTP